MTLSRDRHRSVTQQLTSIALIAVLTAALWYGWFAWDTEYDVDAATGRVSGPYEVWQGIGAFLCSLVVFWLAYRLLHFVVALFIMPIAFTAAWISTASAMDSSGLWLIGAVLVAVGSLVGTALMLGIVAAVEATRRKAARSRTAHNGRSTGLGAGHSPS